MQLIDTHSHLFDVQFAGDLDAVIRRLEECRISKVFLPNIDSTTIDSMHLLENKRPELFHSMMGLHPTSVNEHYEKELESVFQWINKRKYCAIGEIGIDLYWDKMFLKEQIRAFEEQVDQAIEKNLPIVIHTRNSFEMVADSLKKFPEKKLHGIFHSFTGDKDTAEKIFSLGNFKLGINGIVTFKNSGLDHVISQIPLKKVVLETDSPYLAPVPHRGKRNESSFLTLVAKKIAEIKGMSIEEIAEKTTENALEIFSV